MNKQEAKQKLHNIAFAKMNAKPDDLKLADVMQVLNQIDEPQKAVVPKFVAEWLEEAKKNEYRLSYAMNDSDLSFELDDWMVNNEDTFARAWLDGYEIEREKLYTVEVVGTGQYLVERYKKQGYVFIDTEDPLLFTKSELEAAGFGWVFDCEGVKVEEVE